MYNRTWLVFENCGKLRDHFLMTQTFKVFNRNNGKGCAAAMQ